MSDLREKLQAMTKREVKKCRPANRRLSERDYLSGAEMMADKMLPQIEMLVKALECYDYGGHLCKATDALAEHKKWLEGLK